MKGKSTSTAPSSVFSGVKIKVNQETFCLFSRKESTITMPGNYAKYGLKEGDVLTITPVDELIENELYLWEIASEEKSILGCMYWNFGDINIEGKNYTKFELWCVGKVARVNRNYNPAEYLSKTFIAESPIEPNKEEISAICDECKKEMTGSRSFLRTMGWRRKENSYLCVGCW